MLLLLLLLLLLFVNDLPDCVTCKTVMYADDTALLVRSSNPSSLQSIISITICHVL